MLGDEAFTRGMRKLGVNFGKELNELLNDTYYEALSDLSDAEFERAVLDANRSCRHFPRPAELREQVGRSLDVDVLQALQTAKMACGTVGRMNSVRFEDPAIAATIRIMGGWVAFCKITNDEWEKFRAREFKQNYQAFSKSRVNELQGSALPGLEERDCRLKGVPPPKPRLVRSLQPPRVGAERQLGGGGALSLPEGEKP